MSFGTYRSYARLGDSCTLVPRIVSGAVRPEISGQRKITEPLKGIAEKIANTISPDTAKRITGREDILKRVCELAESEASGRRTQLKKVSIRPTWSHEYEERTGVVVDVDIIASDEDRFSYWEALTNSLEELGRSLPPVDRDWLENEVSITVIRS